MAHLVPAKVKPILAKLASGVPGASAINKAQKAADSLNAARKRADSAMAKPDTGSR